MRKNFIADFHLHSHYSIATSKNSNFYEYAKKAYYKGIDLIGTGDGIHPKLLDEIEEYLTEDKNNGLLQLKEEYQKKLLKEIPPELNNKDIRFIITTEISTIYKKNNKVRKLHHLFLIPDLQTAKKISKKLDNIGNIRSDGRPILGMDSAELLKIFLDINENIIYIPAHIWTPHFSLFGAKSGFDTIEECFDDLSQYIYAVETGLSSDPPMNWLISQLDNKFLVSNSDAHSPENLGREANLFYANFSYNGILNALKNINEEDTILGTIEFYPEEGKYHWDGHRKCGIYLSPKEAKKYNNICPICKKPLTMGVLHRVYELADKPENTKGPKAKPYYSIVTLKQIIADSINKSPKSKIVENIYNNIIRANGNEFDILLHKDINDLKINESIIKYAISKVRNNDIYIRPGFDGEYGIVSVFTPEEKKEILSNAIFIEHKIKPKNKKKSNIDFIPVPPSTRQLSLNIIDENKTEILNKYQQELININNKFIFVQAGPGTGKTFTLIKKLETLKKELKSKRILFVTFTETAANEIKNRTNISSTNLYIGTFHSISKKILQEIYNISINLITTQDQIFILQQLGLKKGYSKFLTKVEQYKIQENISITDEEKKLIQKYITYLQENNLYDFDDILLKFIEIHDNNKFPIHYLFVDEVQDCNKLQFNWIKKLSNNLKQLILIGDYYQSLYKFRGAEPETILQLNELFPEIKMLNLKISYRLPQNIINVSSKIISNKPINISLKAASDKKGELFIVEHPDPKIEKSYFAKEIKKLIGTLDMNIGNVSGEYNQNDIAFIFRTNQKLKEYLTYFKTHNLPVKVFFDDTFLKNEKIIKILYALRFIENKNNKFYKNIFYKIIKKSIKFNDEVPKNLLKKINFICSNLNISYDDDIELLTDILINSSDLNSTINEILNHKRISDQKNNINFLTVHSAKGLEFPVVIIPSLQKNYFPIKNGDIEEEERLFYVALTRSSKKIYLSYTINNDNIPSIFINKLKKYGKTIYNYPEKKYRQLSLF